MVRSGQHPRHAHIKSRSGCRNCKRRKVKCSEEHPSCRNCSRRGEQCDFLENGVSRTAYAGVASTRARSSSSQRALPLSRVLLPTDNGVAAGVTNLTMLDLELLHHYSVSTALTLSSDPVVRDYFLVSVPQLGFSHPYVLQSLLALAASHLAHFRPESRQYYYAHAKARHTTATSMAALLLSDISTTNAIPMYCFSIMTLFISFASLRDEEDLASDANDVFPSWLALFRGVRTVLESNNRAIYSSSISFLFYSSEVNQLWQTKQSDLEALLEFQGYLTTSLPGLRKTSRHDTFYLALFKISGAPFTSSTAKSLVMRPRSAASIHGCTRSLMSSSLCCEIETTKPSVYWPLSVCSSTDWSTTGGSKAGECT
ncbi:hypothetical protein BJ166DRAFT_259271 [Pestalotiopsis sp. NC0098]|nr:hypothetical protein BJ166DRAFT_259271 [Pestalotiopsis sp. NC0098]